MEFQSNIPIYVQIMDDIKLQIISGKLQPGDKLASVRDLAMAYGVNPNTMQKALSELEWEHLLYTMRTAGRYVTEDAALIAQWRERLARERITQAVQDLQHLGYQNEEILELLQAHMIQPSTEGENQQ